MGYLSVPRRISQPSLLGISLLGAYGVCFSWQVSGGASGPTLIKSLVSPKLWENAKMQEVVDYLGLNRYAEMPEAYFNAAFRSIDTDNL